MERRRSVKEQWWQPSRWPAYLKTNRLAAVSLAAMLIIGVVVGVLAWPQTHIIHVTGLDQTVTIRTRQGELGAALQEQGILVGADDQVDPPLDTSLRGVGELTVIVKHAIPVTLTIHGESQQVKTSAATVQDLLAEQNVTLEPSDTLTVDPATPVTEGMEVRIVQRTQEVEVVYAEIPYQMLRQDDPYTFIGQSRELQSGEPGLVEIRTMVTYEDGVEVDREVLEENTVREPTPQIIAYGTLGVVSRGGTDYRYTRALDMVATGYTAGKESNPNGIGVTYTGMKAQRGVVAVDPNVIPLYSRLYVDGYGPAIAGDTGGAIYGNRIDLCFDTLEEALQWGVRPVTVYILDE